MAINNYKHNLNEPLVVKDLQITGTRVDNQNTLVFTKSIQLSADGTTGGGLLLGDDGDFVDLNTGYGALRFTSGIQVYSANRGGSAAITLGSDGNITLANSGTTTKGIIGTSGDSDFWFFGGGATGSNAGFAQISTGDDGNEPIYVRQYAGDPRAGTLQRTLTLLNESGNTIIPTAIGIGTTNPTSTLTNFGSFATGLTANTLSVTNDGDGIVRIGPAIINTPTGTGRLNLQDRSGTYLSLYVSTGLIGRLNAPTGTSDIALEVGGTERLRILGATGNIGIGTTNPGSKLAVIGDVYVSGVVTATTFVGALTGTASSTTNIPNLTGAITSNNTTTSLGSFTSSQLATALTDETGSGVAVFATSPTLVTPVLGAATATSIVVSSGSTFTNGPILVGTATSTGTASQRLQVTGGAYVSGNLGVGVTNPATNTQVAIAGTLGISEVDGAGTRTLLSASAAGFVLNHNDNSNIDFRVLSTSKLQYQYSPNFWTIPAGVPFLVGTASSTGTANQLLRVEGGAYISGNLGVGNTNPQNTLDVGVGTIRLINKSSTGRFSQIYQDNNLIFSNSSTNDDFDWTNSSGSRMRLYGTGNLVIPGTFTPTGTAAQRLQVDGGAYVSGSVGIGTTNPTSKLHVVGDVRVSGVVTATTFVGALTGTATSTTNIPNLTGAITSVNTTTSLGSFTSAQLATALTDETGSGANVFATSPTLVTPVLGAASATSINSSGIVTATQFVTGASGSAIGINTNTISGPATITIDPAAVGDNTGAVRIKGDLYVDGTQFIVNSTTIELADLIVGIATTVGTNLLLDGGGIGIGSANILKTITWNNSASALTSSEDWNLVTGKQYEINGTSVLSSTTLGSGVVNSSLTSVGTLGQLNVSGVTTSSRFVSTVSTGTAPLTVSSTTLVTNLNADLLDGQQGSYYLDTSSTAQIKTGNLTVDQLITSNNGNSQNVRVGDDIWLGDMNVSNTMRLRGQQDQTKAYIVFGTSNATALGRDGTGPLTYGGDFTVSDNVGIGTTNPTSKLHVVGNSNITGIVTATELDLTASSSTNNSVLSLTGTPTSASGTNGLFGIGALSFSDTDIIANFTHNVNSYAQLVVQNKNSGASSSADIIVNNDRSAGTTYYGDFGINGTTFSGGGVFGDVDGTYLYSAGGTLSLGSLNSYDVKIATNNTERVRINATGVGIGTDNPGVPLDIATGTGPHLRISSNATSGYGYIQLGRSATASHNWHFGSEGNNYFNFWGGNWGAGVGPLLSLYSAGSTTTHAVLINNQTLTGTASQPLQVAGGAYVSGSVGIGTTNPTSALTVQGDGRFSGVVTGSQLVSTVATGTAPLTVSSTTLVTNLNADLLDGISSASFLRSDTTTTWSGSAGGVFQVTLPASASGATVGSVNTLQLLQGTGNADAFLTFHVAGDYAAHFGLDGTTNDLFYGGWSAGAVKNKVWHQGNDGAGSGLDADLLDGLNSATANTVSTIVARDASGNFSAGTITATTFSGSGASLTSIPNSATTATSANTASAIVARDASGNFSAGTITASLTGNSSTTSGCTFSNDATNKADITTRTDSGFYEHDTATTAEGWPITSNGWMHMIACTHSNDANYYSMQIAASFFNNTDLYYRSTNASGTTAWSKIWNSSNHGSGSGLDADLLDGLNSATANAASTIVARDASGNFSAGTITATSFSGSGASLTSLNASNLGSGTVPVLRLGDSGTRDATTYLRGDNTWQTVSGGATLNNSPSGTLYPTMSSATSGTYSTAYVSSTALTFTTSTGTLSATVFTSLSDVNKKKNIRPIENAIEITKKLEGVRFDWKDTDAPSIGVIAQEVEKVLPELVVENDGVKSVSYGNIVGVLIEAIKEQQVRIEELERKLNA